MLARVRGYVANTDFDWFQTLRARPELTEINFWQPSGGKGFHVLSPGELIFFRLKSPRNAIGGFAMFARHDVVPAWHAWETFREGNGARDRTEMLGRIATYRRRHDPSFVPDPHGNYLIGCLLLVEPIFFAPDEWVRQPDDWPRNVVQGKSYALDVGEGARLARDCLDRLGQPAPPTMHALGEGVRRYGTPRPVAPRLGQATFKIAVEKAYGRSCAITGEHSLPVLEAAHIKPYFAGRGPSGEQRPSVAARHPPPVRPWIRHGDVGRALRRESVPAGRVRERAHVLRARGLAGSAAGEGEELPSPDLLAWHRDEVFRG